MLYEEIDPLEPAMAAGRLRRLGGLAFLDSAMRHETLGRYAFVAAAPFASFSVDAGGASLDGTRLPGPPLTALDALLARYRSDTIAGLPPFQGGAAGFIAYDFAHHLERLAVPPDLDPALPTMRFGLYDTVLAFDLAAGRAFVISTGHPAEGAARAGRARERIATFREALATPEPVPPPAPAGRLDWRSNFFAGPYRDAIERVREYILAGDIYQANIAQTFQTALPEGFDSFELYRRLRQTNAAPFAAFLEYPDLAIASSSPERFLKLTDRRVEARPIKGTAKRSAEPTEDRALAAALLASEKDRAENVMIVDLMRNDLSRVCEADSVEVPVLCGLESYAAVHHLVSVVTGRLRPDRTAADLVAATFPGGSITGAPKLRAMDIITEIERTAREVYCGSIGYFGFDGTMDLNIAIRTVSFRGGRARLSAGGGITVLSEPAAEYEETFTKAVKVFASFEEGPR
ncbi:aminodeoxychorismate synthase component I [Aurantimonas endophytica]|uniref:aminodeoxychorismate synthase n=1 Tax=Aurantimonas endophytica TaxID=1522175 RepID=A0A7W6MP43_9HYPH|nr:aminodeoxychorismate synthase component I [Aurantimonas endophytica]MBB4002539.1 para-aminobenzoate synthetase component 1 [Aurantimonas endophytica]MCO6403420.1 aminodeoxychorismate synthase component I [Aurantimonas endophytica]